MKKRQYQRPDMKEVSLTPEDAVLANCKSNGSNKNNAAPIKCRSIKACTASARGS